MVIGTLLLGAIVVTPQAGIVTAQGPQPQSPAVALGTGFTYQGQLKKNNAPVNDNNCSMTFSLWDSSSGGLRVGGIQPIVPVTVTNGLFTVLLNGSSQFGSSAFGGSGRWLQTDVTCTGDGSPVTLSRQALTAAPYALFASNTNLLGGQDSSAFVNISGAQTISGIKTFSGGLKFPDGTTQTTAFYRPTLPGPGAAATVDSAGAVGSFTSITVGADGLGLISYTDATTDGDLKVFHCSNTVCSSGTATTVDSAGAVGYYTSITIGADGLGLISYYDSNPNYNLKVLHCGNAACNGGNINTTVDSVGLVGYYTSITIGADGLGLISYNDATPNYDLKVFHCSNTPCSSGTATTVDSAGHVGYFTSITIGADGLGLISYTDETTDGDLKVFHCSNTPCSSGTATTVDSPGAVGYYTSITIGADGLGLISYQDATTDGDLKVLHCGNPACNNFIIATTVDSPGIVGSFTSITIGADGLGLISYQDATTDGDLKVFHCSNRTCTPYTRVGR